MGSFDGGCDAGDDVYPDELHDVDDAGARREIGLDKGLLMRPGGFEPPTRRPDGGRK